MQVLLKSRFSLLHLILLVLVLLLVHFIRPTSIDNPSQSIRHPGEFKFTSPLVDCQPNSQQLTPYSQLKNLVNSTITKLISQKQASTISVYFRSLNNGPWIGVNQDELFSPASLLKVPIMMAYYKMAETDPNLLNQKIPYIPTPMVEKPNIISNTTLDPNQNYTIEELIFHMIVYSDNQAFNILTQNLGPQKTASTFKDLDVDLTQTYLNPYGNNLSVIQYASFFRILYNSSYLNPVMSEKALSLLSQVQYDQGIKAKIPNIYPIAHKFGERSYDETGEHQLHDCGIVYYPNEPYLLCIMTRGQTQFENLQKSIQEISQTVFSYLKNHTSPAPFSFSK